MLKKHLFLRPLQQSISGTVKWFSTNTTNTNNSKVFDVVIVGGGMVGGTLASALRNSKFTNELKIGILDPSLSPSANYAQIETPGIRCSAVSASNAALFKRLNLGDEILNHTTSCAFTKMEVWDEVAPRGVIRFDAEKGNSQGADEQSVLGYMVDNQVITNAVSKQLQEDLKQNPDMISFIADKVSRIQLNAETMNPYINHWSSIIQSGEDSKKPNSSSMAELVLGSGEKIYTKLIVAADGTNSQLREQLGMKTVTWNYGQQAVVCTVELESAHRKTAFQRFLRSGPIALLPMMNNESPRNISNIVWSTETEHAKYLLGLSESDFLQALNLAFTSTKGFNGAQGDYEQTPLHMMSELFSKFTSLPRAHQVKEDNISTSALSIQVPKITGLLNSGKRAAFPLRRLHATEYVRPRFALIGDAAHTVHPQAGQGVNLGFGDVIQLTKSLQHALQSGSDIGSILNLQQNYESPQFKRNEFMMGVMEALFRVFHYQGPVPIFRGFGMFVLDQLAPDVVKQKMMELAAGAEIDVSTIGDSSKV